jgi:hypothetical protein
MKQAYCRPPWGLPARAAVPFTQRLAQAGIGAALLLALPGLAQAQTITGFSPTSGVAGTPITLTGTGLTDVSSVMVNGVGVVPTNVTATSLLFVVPAGTSTNRVVIVTTRIGTSAASSTFEVVPLKVTGTTPAANALTAPLANSVVGLTFTEPVTAASAANLRVYSAQLGGRKTGNVTVSGNSVGFKATAGTPRTSFKPGETVSVSVPATVLSAGGLAASRRVYQFTTAVGGTGRGNFRPGPGTDPAVGTNPVGVATGDMDGDGDLDLVANNYGNGTVSVRLNGGDATGSNTGTFSGGSDPAVGPNPNLVTLADLDGDRDLDMLAPDGTTNTVSVRLNQGPAPTLTAVAPSPGGLGQAITLTGTNLGSPTALTINGANALPNIISNTGTSLAVRVPLGAAATGTVSVTTVAGPATRPFAVMLAPGNSLAFDGVNDYVRPAGTLPATGEFTLETWVNPTALSSSPNSLSAVLMTDYFVVGSMHCQFYGNRLGFSVGGNSPVDQVSNLALPVGRWAHVAVVYSASAKTAKFYFNGTLVDARTYTTAGSIKANLYTVGAWQANGAPQRYFNGKLDELRVYGAARTQAQVQADMLSTAPAASLSFYLNFDQGTPGGNNAGLTTLYDLTSAQPATLNNFALNSGNTTSNYVPGYVPETPPATPTDADPTANAVAENAATGTPVGLTVAVLGATNATLTYSLTDNAGGRFAIDAATGVVTVANGALLDYETATSYPITAQASDDLLSSRATFTIALTDVNEAPVVAAQAYSTQEDGAAGTLVGTVLATDPDAGQAMTYTITAGNTGGAFALVGNQLQVANPAALDYAATPTFTLTVAVADNGTPALTTPATLTVTLTPAPCAAPTAVALSGFGPRSVTVRFAGSPTATGYVVSYTGGGTTASVSSATSPVTLTGLQPNTTYAITVASTCSRTQTAAAAPVSFMTFCEVPTLAAIANQQVNVDAGQCGASVSLVAQTGGTPAPSVVFVANGVLLTSPYVFPVGTTSVTATANSCGGTVARTFTVTVADNANPTIAAPANLTVSTDPGQCAATAVALGTPTTADNCAVATVTNDAPPAFPKGTTTVTWTATDRAGNQATATQTVTVVDQEAPGVYGPANVALFTERGACTADCWRLRTPAIGEACGNVQLTNNAPANFPKGSTTVTWTATDDAGNVGTLTQVVTVTDNERPMLTIPADLRVGTDATQCAATGVALGTPTIADNCPGVTVTNSAPATFPKGITGVVWTATDAAGNTTTDVQYVTVVDDVAPVIVAPAAVAVASDAGQCTATNVALGTPTATDNCAIASVYNDAPATFPQGTTTVTWTATDNSGNQRTTTQLVTVRDNVNPTIAAPAAIAATTDAGQCTATNVLLGTATAADNCTSVTVTNDAPATFAKGATTVTWTVTDAAGNTATATQVVTVTDAERPTIAAPAAIAATTDAGQCTATNVLLGTATAADNCTGVVVTNNAPSTFAKGTTTVTWTATDASGNQATATQTVTVRDTERPVLAALPNLRLNAPATACGAVVSFAPSAGDNCPGTTVVASPASGSTFALGTTTVTVTATDAAGNKVTSSFIVTVSDVTPPTARTRNLSVALANGTATITAAQLDNGSADACGPVTLALSKTSFTCANAGTNTVTLTVTDAAGNVATAPATVTVTGGAVTPTVSVAPASLFDGKQYRLYLGYGAQSATLTATGGVSYTWSPATGLSNPNVANPTFAPTAEGTYTFTVTATSVGGCQASSTVVIVVEDVRCGNNNDKVQVCHNGQVICVASSALSTHLGHGDRLGSCAASRTTALAATSAAADATPALAVYPNPTRGAATLTGAPAGATVTVLDAVGRVVLSATADATGTAKLALPVGQASGVYVVRAGQQALRLTVE